MAISVTIVASNGDLMAPSDKQVSIKRNERPGQIGALRKNTSL